MNIINTRMTLNLYMRAVLRDLMSYHGLKTHGLAKQIGVHFNSIEPILKDSKLNNVKTESYFKYIHHLNAKIFFIAKNLETGKEYRHNYTGVNTDIGTWAQTVCKDYAKEHNTSVNKLINELGITTSFNKRFVTHGKKLWAGSPFRLLEDLYKIGYATSIYIEHPCIRVKDNDSTDLLMELVNSKEDDTWLDMLKEETIFAMQSGKVNCSLGGTVRAFL